MLKTIITGFVVGICVSAPVGPLGILCIQRTISRGRLHGFVTGLGATTSDIIYALLVGFSMGMILDFIEAHEMVIQILGSIIIGGFGLHIYTKDPKQQLIHGRQRPSKGDLFSDYFTAFGLCFSNPLIIFLFIGLFARFTLIEPHNLGQTLVGLLSILSGASVWWLTLTMLVGLFRNKFKEQGLWVLNKITGSILLILAFLGVIMAVSEKI